MKIAAILRSLADTVDRQSDSARPDEDLQNPAELAPVETGPAVEIPDNQDVAADDDIMIPPLQLKTELLKRAVGVDNVYDEDGPRSEQADNTESDSIKQLKHNAGIPTAAVMTLSDEEITDD